jgi:hypothetical protein
MEKNISVIGVGRLGICVALVLEKFGYNVLGSDIIQEYVDSINNKTLVSPEPSVTDMLLQSKNFKATTSLEEILTFSDTIFIYVATPSSGGEKHYDHTTLGNVLSSINNLRVSNKHIVIGCTVIPGYCRDVANFLVRDCQNTTVSYNPEFIAQGDIVNGILKADFILIGEGSVEAGDRLEKIYKTVSPEVSINRMSPSSAEITKLGVNCFITTKVAFANMIGDLADVSPGSDKFDILKAIGSDSRIGQKYLKPGYGFGGPCFPRDNRALGGYIKKMGLEPLIPEATDISNRLHTKFQIDKLLESDIKEITISGVTYKENCRVPIIEESQKLVIAKKLAESGVKVTVEDYPNILHNVMLEYGNLFTYSCL